MPEILFYHLTETPLEKSLPEMLERGLGRGWRAVVRAGSEAGLAAVDAMLWTWRDDAFLPHGTAAMGHAARQPVYLTTGREVPNGAGLLMLVDGARLDAAEAPGFDRVCVVFDGHDPAAVLAAREDWTVAKAGGWPAKYWAQAGGRWVERG